jgi:lipopolysaccharide transport system ATP-binding protein
MGKIVLQTEKLGKRYRLGTPAGHDRLSEALYGLGRTAASLPRRLWQRNGAVPASPPPPEEFWALRDVSFEVREGEVVGIIGRNGAGKSTLLKILSHITEPTTGRFGLRGRVGSLLEVGTGFHPELTGRENIYLNGTILGMSRAEVQGKFDDIVGFADIGDFLDTPVKRYSSGMIMRLGFAVAAHLQPEILIVDEVLAVGDAAFQKKCLAKMEEVGRGGRTILFVSHNLLAVQTLCSRALWLDKGCLLADSSAEDVVARYLERGGGAAARWRWDNPVTAPQKGEVRLCRVTVNPGQADDPTGREITLEDPVDLAVVLENSKPDVLLNLSVHIGTAEGTTVFATTTAPTHEPMGTVLWSTRIPAHFLNAGTYTVSVFIVRDENMMIGEAVNAVVFEVVERRRETNWYGRWPGVVRPRLVWEVRRQPGPLSSYPGENPFEEALA